MDRGREQNPSKSMHIKSILAIQYFNYLINNLLILPKPKPAVAYFEKDQKMEIEILRHHLLQILPSFFFLRPEPIFPQTGFAEHERFRSFLK